LGIDPISVFTPVPSSINKGAIKSLGLKIVSATMLLIAGVVRRRRGRRGRNIGEIFRDI
jgi:hypothetical protein